MNYFFFDIDGTLLMSGGAGRVAMSQVMDEMFGLKELNKIKVHGRTDYGIIHDLFESHDIPLDQDTHQEFSNRYHGLLDDALQQCDGVLLDGVVELLKRLVDSDNNRLGILTGNSEPAAKSKLRHFGLESYFEFGGYGQWHAERNDVARVALEACRSLYANEPVHEKEVWVVGDTENDVRCARSIDANVVAVATGGATMEELRQGSPDVLLPDLANVDAFLRGVGIRQGEVEH